MATVTLKHVFAAGRRITRMNGEDYGRYWQGYREDSNRRRRQRNAANKARAEAMLPWDTVVPPGEYGRLEVLPDGGIYYCAGQYAPTEYYGAVEQLCWTLRNRRNAAA